MLYGLDTDSLLVGQNVEHFACKKFCFKFVSLVLQDLANLI